MRTEESSAELRVPPSMGREVALSFSSSPLSVSMVLTIKILLTSHNNFEDSFSATFPQCGQLDKFRLRTLTFVLCSQLRDCVVAEIIPWRDRLRFARCVASFHLEPAPRRACRRPTATQRPRARSEHRTCDTSVCKLAVPHCSCEK